jgi:hypothetical protein
VSERRWASWPVAAVVALLVAHGLAALIASPNAREALFLSGAVLVIAAAAGLASLRLVPDWVVAAATLAAALGSAILAGFGAAIGCLGAGGAAHFVAQRLPDELPEALEGAGRRHPRLRVAWAVVAVACVLSYARLAVFMQDVEFHTGAVLPTRPAKHMCLPAYLHGAELAAREPAAVYASDRYGPGDRTDIAGMERWMRDPFMYPPPALIPAQIAVASSRDFRAIRAVWFALQALFFVAVSLALARALAPRAAALHIALWPALAMAWPTLYNFEFGQAHLFTLGLAVAGMLALSAERPLVGGALLGGAIAIKVFPGLLALYLLLRRRFADALAATVGTLVWLAVAVLVVGPDVSQRFVVDHLPRLASGEAFATFIEHAEFDTPHLSPQALVFTLRALGVPGMDWTAARALAVAYTLLVLAAALIAARRPDHPAVWLGLLALGASRSPYAPAAYVMVGAVWLAVVLAAELRERPRLAGAVLAVGAFLQTVPFLGSLPPFWSWPILSGWATPVMTALAIGLSLWSLSRSPYGLA